MRRRGVNPTEVLGRQSLRSPLAETEDFQIVGIQGKGVDQGRRQEDRDIVRETRIVPGRGARAKATSSHGAQSEGKSQSKGQGRRKGKGQSQGRSEGKSQGKDRRTSTSPSGRRGKRSPRGSPRGVLEEWPRDPQPSARSEVAEPRRRPGVHEGVLLRARSASCRHSGRSRGAGNRHPTEGEDDRDFERPAPHLGNSSRYSPSGGAPLQRRVQQRGRSRSHHSRSIGAKRSWKKVGSPTLFPWSLQEETA